MERGEGVFSFKSLVYYRFKEEKIEIEVEIKEDINLPELI